MKFPEDCYPGVWIRGEDALRFVGGLESIKYQLDEKFSAAGVGDPVKELIEILESCRIGRLQ